MRRWRGGDRVLVRMGGTELDPVVTWAPGRVLRAPCEAREVLRSSENANARELAGQLIAIFAPRGDAS